MNDNIVEEVHAIRAKILEECDNDSEKLAAYLLKLQEESDREPRSPTDKRTKDKPASPSE
jgi:hypothetical protein